MISQYRLVYYDQSFLYGYQIVYIDNRQASGSRQYIGTGVHTYIRVYLYMQVYMIAYAGAVIGVWQYIGNRQQNRCIYEYTQAVNAYVYRYQDRDGKGKHILLVAYIHTGNIQVLGSQYITNRRVIHIYQPTIYRQQVHTYQPIYIHTSIHTNLGFGYLNYNITVYRQPSYLTN